MSFVRDKGRMYFDGLCQRAEAVKNLPQDINHRLGLNYNIVCVLTRLEEVRKLFTKDEITLKPLLKDLHERDVVNAIRENRITLQEVSDQITSLQDCLIDRMGKCLIHMELLPIMDTEEFEKSDNREYIHEIFISSLNNLALDVCLHDVSLLPESKDKKDFMESIHHMKKKIAEYKVSQQLKGDDDSDSDWTGDEFESDEEFGEFKDIPFHEETEVLPEQKPLEEKPILREAASLPPPTQSCSIWYKLGMLMLTTGAGIGAGVCVGVLAGGWGMPIGMVIGAVFGFMIGLRLIWSKDSCCSMKQTEILPTPRTETRAPIKFFPEYGKLNKVEKMQPVEIINRGLTKSI